MDDPTETPDPDPVEPDSVEPDDDPFGPGWWVGSDGYWHPPDERFGDDTPDRSHPLRRVAVVVLVLAVIGATSVGVWAGAGGPSTPTPNQGPPVSELTTRVQQSLGGVNGLGVSHITGVSCHQPASWTAGRTFTCEVYASPHQLVGRYRGTVLPSSSGAWNWRGTWSPDRPAVVNE